jgi:hypothetical protein
MTDSKMAHVDWTAEYRVAYIIFEELCSELVRYVLQLDAGSPGTKSEVEGHEGHAAEEDVIGRDAA